MMRQNLSISLLLILGLTLIISVIMPRAILAQSPQNYYWPLKEEENTDVLDIIQRKISSEVWITTFTDKPPREGGALIMIREAIRQKEFNYYFKDVPKELSKKFLKAIFQIGLTISTQGSYGIYNIIDQLEKISVKKASAYAINWLLRNQIKVGSGKLEYSYNSYKDPNDPFKTHSQITFNYIIVYKPEKNNSLHGMIVVEFYSPNYVTPPQSLGRTPWNFDSWRQEGNKKLPPFIVRVKGQVLRKPPPALAIPGINDFATYNWDSTKGEPIVEVDFDSPVPEIDNSDIILSTSPKEMKRKFIVQKWVMPLLQSMKVKSDITRKGMLRIGKEILSKAKDFLGQIKSELKNLSLGGAQIGEQIKIMPKKQALSNNHQLSTLSRIVNKTEENNIPTFSKNAENRGAENEKANSMSADIFTKNNPSSREMPENKSITTNRKLTLEELQEKFDDISERADIVIAKTNQLLADAGYNNGTAQIKKPEKTIETSTAKESATTSTLVKEKNPGQENQIMLCSLKPNESPQRNKIIFNEIAWMGTIESSNDEWIELKNISGNSIDMTGWQILDKAAMEKQSPAIKIFFPTTTILSPGGFFLLERSDDDTVPNIQADFIYTGSLGNHNEALYLFNSQCQLQDTVQANPNWPAGSNDSKKTMERKPGVRHVSDTVMWQTSLNPGGTPKAENSQGEIILAGIGISGNVENSSLPSSPISENPKITLSFPEINPANKEILVAVHASNLKTDTLYDIKISIENASGTISEIFDEDKNDWQSSVFYLAKRLSSASSSQTLKLRIKKGKQDFRGKANIIAKIRENGKNNYYQTVDVINITEPENRAPSANFVFSPQNPKVGEDILFNASSSSDPDGQIVTYTWDFGDSSSTILTLATTTHSFAAPGIFQIILQVTDNKGATSSTSTTLQVTENPQPKIADHLIISEVQTKDKEFVELYNPTKQSITTTNWYLSYFSENKNWNEPKAWKFPTTTIASSSYYLIGVSNYPTSTESGYPKSDWIILGKTTGKPYTTGQLKNNVGAIGIFSCDPRITTSSSTTLEEAVTKAKSCKIDLFSWKKESVSSSNTEVYEGEPFSFENSQIEEKSFQRRKTQEGNYLDSNNNSQDFEINYPTPTNSKGERGNIQPPSSVQNFQLSSSTDHTATLTWSPANDPDTSEQDISYIVYWAKEEISEKNATITNPTAFSTSTATTSLTLVALDYNSTYYFGIRAFDGKHYSELSTTTPFNTPLAPIVDLNAGPSAVRKAIDIFWTSNGATKYIIKFAEKEIVGGNATNTTNTDKISWEVASLAGIVTSSTSTLGNIESFRVRDLTPNTRYYFAIKSINAKNATSEISNIAKSKAIPGFQDNGDGTITDLYTGLMWVKDGRSAGANNGQSLNWDSAKTFANQLNFAGYQDWRLPNFKELASIIDYDKKGPSIDENYFTNTTSTKYWTSSYQYFPGINYAPPRWDIETIDFNTGLLEITSNKNSLYYLRPVRGPDTKNVLPVTEKNGDTTGCNLGLKDNGNGTLTDLCTGLVWAKAGFAQTCGVGIGEYLWDNRKTWEEAIKFAQNRVLCQDGTFQGSVSEKGDCTSHNGVMYDDFRLPNIQELLNVIKKDPLSPLAGNVNLYFASYWSSTCEQDGHCWIINEDYDEWRETSVAPNNAKNVIFSVQIVRDND